MKYTYNRQAERTSITDQRGCVRTLDYDKLARQIHDRMNPVGQIGGRDMIDVADTCWHWGPILIRFVGTGPPICYPIVEDASGAFEHTFGGETHSRGAICNGCPVPVHLMFTFDLADKSVPIHVNGTGSVSLFYPIQYNLSPIWYRMLGDSDIEIIDQPDTRWLPDFPFAEYPKSYPKKRVRLDHPRQLKLPQGEGRSFQETYGDQSQDSLNLVEWACGLTQGVPRSTCINPECRQQAMSLFAIVPIDDLYGFELAWPDSNVTLTYEICPRCSMIHATEQA